MIESVERLEVQNLLEVHSMPSPNENKQYKLSTENKITRSIVDIYFEID